MVQAHATVVQEYRQHGAQNGGADGLRQLKFRQKVQKALEGGVGGDQLGDHHRQHRQGDQQADADGAGGAADAAGGAEGLPDAPARCTDVAHAHHIGGTGRIQQGQDPGGTAAVLPGGDAVGQGGHHHQDQGGESGHAGVTAGEESHTHQATEHQQGALVPAEAVAPAAQIEGRASQQRQQGKAEEQMGPAEEHAVHGGQGKNEDPESKGQLSLARRENGPGRLRRECVNRLLDGLFHKLFHNILLFVVAVTKNNMSFRAIPQDGVGIPYGGAPPFVSYSASMGRKIAVICSSAKISRSMASSPSANI